MKICIINGPNLNLTGIREPEIYGYAGFDAFMESLRADFNNVEFDYFQSNVEGELINKLHEAGFTCDGIIINAGAYAHTSIALGDAVKAVKAPVAEVHISNVWAREEYRHFSYISSGAVGVIAGFGLRSYRLAVLSFLNR